MLSLVSLSPALSDRVSNHELYEKTPKDQHHQQSCGVVYVDCVKNNDILSGTGGKKMRDHPGNKRLYELVAKHATAYGRATRKADKAEIQRCILSEILSNGDLRVLKKHPVYSTWYVAPNAIKVLQDKISHRLRSMLRGKSKVERKIPSHVKVFQNSTFVPLSSNSFMNDNLTLADLHDVLPTAADCVDAFSDFEDDDVLA